MCSRDNKKFLKCSLRIEMDLSSKLEKEGRKKKINLYPQSNINHQKLENIGTTMSELVSSQGRVEEERCGFSLFKC